MDQASRDSLYNLLDTMEESLMQLFRTLPREIVCSIVETAKDLEIAVAKDQAYKRELTRLPEWFIKLSSREKALSNSPKRSLKLLPKKQRKLQINQLGLNAEVEAFQIRLQSSFMAERRRRLSGF